jgi:hypothetical protein
MGKDGSLGFKRKKLAIPFSRKRKTADSNAASTVQNGSSSSNTKRRTTDGGGSNHNPSSTDGGAAAFLFYEEYCELPFSLRTVLVDEYKYITRKRFDSPPNGYDCQVTNRPTRFVHVLPSKVTVRQVLQHYLRKRGGGGSNNSDDNDDSKSNQDDDDDNNNKSKNRQKVRKFCEGLALLFDDALPVCLLYEEERPQYESLQHDEDLRLKRPCEIYGSTFLLRLLVRLPRLLAAEPNSEMEGE